MILVRHVFFLLQELHQLHQRRRYLHLTRALRVSPNWLQNTAQQKIE